MTYGLRAFNKQFPSNLTPMHTDFMSEESVASHYDLYLTDELTRDEEHHVKKFYRLHANKPHNIEMALAYNIKCPRCGGALKQVGRTLDFNTLGLYECPICNGK